MGSATTDRRLGLTADKGMKAPVTVAATGALTLSGEQTIDGVAVKAVNAAGVPDRVLALYQADSTTNGIWDVSTGTWTRSIDADANTDWKCGGLIPVALGSQAGQFFRITTSDPIIPGTSQLTFTSALVSQVAPVVPSIANLRMLSKVTNSKAFVTGYYAQGDGGGGQYYYDSTDIISADNGGTIIVAADGGRWKLVFGLYLSVKQFGAKGDGLTDDTAAIQAAINYVCNQTTTTIGNGGGRLFFPAGKYRFTDTLRIGYGLCMEGVWGGGYPFPGASTQTSTLYADFGSSINKWAIDSQTFHSVAGGGGRILYNEWVDGSIDGTAADGFNSIHGLSIKNILLVDANVSLQTNVIYGSIRLVGCPNANIENFSINGFGLSLTLNCSFGTKVRNITSQTNYFGLMAYNANNGIDVQGQFDKIVSPSSLTVPVGVIPSWMPSTAAFSGGSFNMNASHYQSSKGITIAAAQAVGSNGATIDVIAQYWDDTTFLYNSYSTTFTQLYAEQCAKNVMVTCFCSFNVLNAHNYSTIAPLPYFGDFGYQSVGEINVGGNNTALAFFQNCWGSVSAADPTYILVHSTANAQGPAVALGVIPIPSHQRINKLYEEGFWTPTLSVPAGALTTVGACSGSYTKVGRLVTAQFSCALTTNGTGAGYIIVGGLPYGVTSVSFVSGGREQGVSGKMTMVQAQAGTSTAFVWFYDGTYPGANGAIFNGSITYQT